MNASLLKRFSAYIVDILILGFFISLSLSFIGNDKLAIIENLNTEMTDLTESYLEEKIDSNEFIKNYAIINQKIDRTEIAANAINAIFIILLFIFGPLFLNGQTLGMKLFRIKVVKNNGDEATILDYVFRCLLFYFLGYLLITLGLVYFTSSLIYFIISFILSFLEFLLVIISAFMILYRHDQKGLHDIITKTKVVKV